MTENIQFVSSVFNVCLSFTKHVRLDSEKLCTFVITEQCVTEAGKFLLQQQDKLHEKTGLLKKPYKQPFFVNEYKFEVGWQSSSLSSSFLDLAEQNILNIFLANPTEPYSTTSYEYVNILTLGGL